MSDVSTASTGAKRGVTWKDLSDVRGLLYGLSIISIMVFHYTATVVGAKQPGDKYYDICNAYSTIIGSIGVDVFVIMSGYGIYHSLSKSFDLGRYYLRRAKRVLLPYVIAGLAFWLVKDLWVLGLDLGAFVRDFTWVSFVTAGTRTVWYVPFILTMYLVAPLVFKLMEHHVPATLLAALSVAACLGMRTYAPGYLWNTEIALMRIPAFFLGMACGKLARSRETIPVWLLAVLPLGFVLKFATGDHGQLAARALNVLYGAAIIDVVVLLQWIARSIAGESRKRDRKPTPLRRLVDVAGANSYELYLTHVLLRNLLGTVGGDLTDPWVYTACMAVSVLAAWLLAQVQRVRPAARHAG